MRGRCAARQALAEVCRERVFEPSVRTAMPAPVQMCSTFVDKRVAGQAAQQWRCY